MMILREVRMSCTNGHSDKQYDLSIQYDNITYHVMAHYGRRGTSLIPTRKGDYAACDRHRRSLVPLDRVRPQLHVPLGHQR